jgi:uncharacterized phage protein gp47/JayE
MYDFLAILTRMLATIPDTFDKREGSIIYDALSPAAVELAQMYINLEIFKEQTYVLTATGINLDNRGADFAIHRFQATNAIRISRMYNFSGILTDIEIGMRFATPSETGGLIYFATEKIDEGTYLLKCEMAGTIGNEHYGDILPLFIRNNLGRAIIDGTWQPARDTETDDDYRKRIIARLSAKAFGGNVADYKRFTSDIDGVGTVKVFPIWNGGGTVLISVVDSSFNPVSPEFINIIKNTIDPEEETGLGIGIAPIGHVVTVTTPEKIMIDIECGVTLDNRTVGQVQQEVEINLRDYIFSLRQNWSENAITNVFISMIIAYMLKVDRLINVTNVKINGVPKDLHLVGTAELQQLPFLGRVVMYEA